jgi:4a-hydroxytetrahydrobiopterin dehydratase
MKQSNKLSSEQVRAQLEKLNAHAGTAWELLEGKLHKQFTFKDFQAAMTFMQSVAIEAEKLDHHPEWCNVYNRVSVDLVTHSAGGITELDFLLASKMQALC